MFIVTISSCQTSLTPAATNLAEAYDIHVLKVTFTSIVFMITYIPMTFVAIFSYNHYRVSNVFRVACLNAIFGGWLRTLSMYTNTFEPIMSGFVFISFSYPFMLSSITMICN